MRRLLACLALLSAVGCAHAPKSGARDPFPCPAAGGRTWRELTSANFVLRTDFDEPAARTALQSYEDTLATFKDIVELFLPAAEPPTRTSIIVFADWRQFHQLLSDKMAGVFIRHDEHRRPLIVLPSYANETMFRHELMHRLIHQRLPDLPDWLNEGLAEYFSTVDLRDGKAFVGGTTARGSLLTDARYYGASHLERVHEMPSVSVLVRQSHEQFHATDGRSYLAAWALVHLLANGSADSAVRFRAFLAAIADGAPPAEALAAHYGAPEPLERQYREHLHELGRSHREMRLLVFPYVPRSRPCNIGVRTLDDSEVHVVRAQLRSRPGDWKPELALAHQHAPASAATAWFDHRVALSTGDSATAARALDRAIAAAPDDPFYRFIKLDRLIWAEIAKPPAARNFDAFAADVQKLARAAHDAEQLDLVAAYYSLRGDFEMGLPFAHRAVERDPQCSSCLDTLGVLYAGKGLANEAIAVAAAALRRWRSSEPPPPEWAERLSCYRAHTADVTQCRPYP